MHRRHSQKRAYTLLQYSDIAECAISIRLLETYLHISARVSKHQYDTDTRTQHTYANTSLSFVRAYNVLQFLHATGYNQEVRIYHVFSKRFDLYHDVTSRVLRGELKKKKKKNIIVCVTFRLVIYFTITRSETFPPHTLRPILKNEIGRCRII